MGSARNIFTTLAFVAIFFGATSCASPPSPDSPNRYHPVSNEVSKPPIGVVTTASIGDSMIEQGHYTELDAIELSSPISVGLLSSYTFTAGTYVKQGENSDGEFFVAGNILHSGQIQVSPVADPFQAILLEPDGATICGVSVFHAKFCTASAPVKRVKALDTTADYFQQTLIYNGLVGDKIDVAYREFSGNLARPAFGNQVEYDLKQSKTIGYKSAVIEVLEATNQYIKYIVRHNFNQAIQ